MTLRRLAILAVFLGVPMACAPLATFFAPESATMEVTVPGTAATDRAPSNPTYTAVVHGQGGGEALKEIGGVLPPPFGTILGVAGTILSTAGSIYMAAQSKKSSRNEKVLDAVIAGVEAAGEGAALVKKAIQAKARKAGPDVSAALEARVAKEGGAS